MNSHLDASLFISDSAPQKELLRSDSHQYPQKIDQIKKLSYTVEELVPPEFKKLNRSMSRAAAMLIYTVQKIKSTFSAAIKQDPFSVGIYCAIEGVPVDYPVAQDLSKNPEADWPEIIRKSLPPKQQIKGGPGIAPAVLGVTIGAMGPVTNFYDRHFGVMHAIQQACLDIKEGRIQFALICGALAIDDPLLNLRVSFQENHLSHLCEGAAVLLLTENNIHLNWKKELTCDDYSYGIASPLINYLLRMGIK